METGTGQTVLIIDDHPLFRRGVSQLLSMDPVFLVVGEAASGKDGYKLAAALSPDIILLDLDMKDMDGIQTLETIRANDIDSRIIVLTVSDNEEHVVNALRAGADGYLLKDMEPEDILASLVMAARGHVVLTDRIIGMLAHALRPDASTRALDRTGLTKREQGILVCIAQGKSNKLIARELQIAEGTVKVHVKHLLKKLHLRSRVEAAVWAVEQSRRDL
ncbi:MAG: two-component system response regulator NarL [Gammaproteobacteria bacterium]|nr:two-component system response regulator NarL [Gammaproteobacteria bacterium]